MTDSDPGRTSTPAWYAPKRWLYRGGRPGRIASAMNAFWARLYARGWLAFGRGATLEVRGRTSGRTVTLPVAIADHDGGPRRYLAIAPGARPHIPVARTAPLAELERVAADHPAFRIEGAAG